MLTYLIHYSIQRLAIRGVNHLNDENLRIIEQVATSAEKNGLNQPLRKATVLFLM